jgi:predicted nuclease of predicted toxin-antitoxin system
MRVLLDNCVNQRFGKLLANCEAIHVRQLGWADLSNGKLIAAAEEAGFDVLLTVDQNVRKQQNMSARKISLVTLDARSITIAGLVPFVSPVEEALSKIEKDSLQSQDYLVTMTKTT